jgi:Flp pilus assembly pilin Flp
MLGLKDLLRRFADDMRGATTIEYGLIAVLVAVGILVSVQALGSGNSSSWGNTQAKVSDAMQKAGK